MYIDSFIVPNISIDLFGTGVQSDVVHRVCGAFENQFFFMNRGNLCSYLNSSEGTDFKVVSHPSHTHLGFKLDDSLCQPNTYWLINNEPAVIHSIYLDNKQLPIVEFKYLNSKFIQVKCLRYLIESERIAKAYVS